MSRIMVFLTAMIQKLGRVNILHLFPDILSLCFLLCPNCAIISSILQGICSHATKYFRIGINIFCHPIFVALSGLRGYCRSIMFPPWLGTLASRSFVQMGLVPL